MAWLHTVPEKAKQPRYKTRVVSMPPLDGGMHLINIMLEIGPTKVAGMGGVVGIDELDIAAWQFNSGISLTAWEAQTIRSLSQVYAAASMNGREASALPPYTPPAEELKEEQRQRISNAMSDWADKFNATKRGP
jgi:hypothetical protein